MWEGEIDLLGAVRDGAIELQGARWLVRALPHWLEYSEVAPLVRATRGPAT
jgi:hypothetical protein